MQNKLIIGGAVVLVAIIGYLIYSTPAPDQTKFDQDNYETDVATTTAEMMATLTATSTATATTTKTINKKMSATYKVKMETNKGNIELELNTNIAPKTVENFLKLTNEGFYNGVKFHRVIKDFMIQTGDPQTKDDKLVNAWGTGGPGYKFADEITDPATYQIGYKRGILAMANSGPNTNGSQFFIMHKDVALPPNYTIFGRVISGLDIVDAIANVQTTGPDRPVEAVIINKISVE